MQAQKLKDRLTQIHGPGKPIILAGNKLDLESDREVPEEEAYQYAVSQQVGFFECSAKVTRKDSLFCCQCFVVKEFINVTELFSGVVRLIDRYRQNSDPSASSDGGSGEGRTSSSGGGNSDSNGGGGKKKCVIL
jgi:GTPase SAR1 family protein